MSEERLEAGSVCGGAPLAQDKANVERGANGGRFQARQESPPFCCVVADPPWSFGDKLPGPGRGAEKHYPVLDIAALETFTLPPISNDAWLFMWRVASQVEEAYRVVRAWGFVAKSEIVWIKRTATGKRWFGMGRSVRAEHEVAIIAKRGRPELLSRSTRSTFEAAAGRHSAKPDAFFDLVEALVPGPRVELFARRHRAGWTCLGNELEAR